MISMELKASVEASGVCRATIYRWKKLFRDSGGKLESLISKIKGFFKRKRQKEWHPEVINFILDYKKKHPKLGKEKKTAESKMIWSYTPFPF